MKSVVNELGTEEFARIRVGIGQPEYRDDLINYVTKKISKEESQDLQEGVNKATDAIIEILKNSIDSAMNKYN